MCNRHDHVHTIECIIPPHMMKVISMRGNEAQRRMALSLVEGSQQFNSKRELNTPSNSFKAANICANPTKPAIKIYDAQNTFDLPGQLKRETGGSVSVDADVNSAFEGSEVVHSLYQDVYGRNSLDGNGMTMQSSVHVGNEYNNAFWDGTQMAYGDGDGFLFQSFAADLSIIGHELSHGVVQHSGGLVYSDQSGALNESFADIFGSLVVQYKHQQQANNATWLVGENSFTPNINGDALRSLKQPGSAYNDPTLGQDIQPYHMDYYVYTNEDRGGVHINSGIPNHAFYLLAQYLGGFAWEKAGHIWYDALQNINKPQATFVDWANETILAARKRFGSGSIEERFVWQAWKMVGVY